AHTLYAPREVVLWNWRRILLLGLSIALAVGSQFSLVMIVPIALALMLYVAPSRRRAALAIWGAACVIAGFLLLSSYFFDLPVFWAGLRHADFIAAKGAPYAMAKAYQAAIVALTNNSPALVLAIPASLLTLLFWRRTQYFGNLVPLLVGAI